MLSAVEELDRIAALCACLHLDGPEQDLASRVLEPVAALLGADTASLRRFGFVHGAPAPVSIVDSGIPSFVRADYLERYFELDPIRPLLGRRLTMPMLAPDPVRCGDWLGEHAAPARRAEYRHDFRRYRREFLLPNDFYHHLGFYMQGSPAEILAFDFHRTAGASRFGALERARARIVAGYLHATAGKRRFDWSAAPCTAALTKREAEIADAVAAGLSNKRIAQSCRISVRTVENHLRSIFAKCNVSTRTQLAATRRASRGS